MLLTTVLLACRPSEGELRSDPAKPVVDEIPSTGPVLPTTPTTEPAPSTTTPPDPGPLTAADCFADIWGESPPVDYDQFAPVMNSQCAGTNHQDIEGIERVVFIGDSITLGTPPTPSGRWWRNQLVDAAVAQFGLTPPSARWGRADIIEGDALETFSGDFAVCARWGARTDDLLQPSHYQLETCMPEADRALRTLVVMTVGGNDIYSLLKDERDGADEATLRETYAAAVQLLREAIGWLVEPGRFPNGVWVVFANTYDFTDPDSAEEMAQCSGAQLIGMAEPLRSPVIQDILADAQEQYLQIATETGTDLVFLGEAFCGHGYNRDDPDSRCYRGPGAELWLDLTCEHPNSEGHDALTDLMIQVISE